MKAIIILLLTAAAAFANPPATLISPRGLVAHSAPTIRWKPIPNITQYLLHVDQGSTPVYRQWVTAAQARCTNECKFILPVDLKPGDYTWMLSYRLSTGYGPWSETVKFTVKELTLDQTMGACLQQFIECKAVAR